MLEKTYDPNDIEKRVYPRWEESGAFRCGGRPGASPYAIVIPPPNVTGTLHMGHALDNTLQDVLARYHRLRGFDVLWQPGTDHAGIATQMVVERHLAEEGLDRRDLGRKEFVRRVRKWKETSGGAITRQLRRLGASCDWDRECFTLDPGPSAAVAKVFVTLYNEGLIYRDRRLVNWDPKLLTAISDLEVDQREVQGHLWHIRYPIEGEDRSITVATTRPETMLGDTGVTVHPDDERYKDLIGKYAILPLVHRPLPIVADEHADPEQGSGAVKITPAHDFNDFEVGQRHELAQISVLDEHARIIKKAVVLEKYYGMDRYEARDAIVEDLKADGALEEIEDHTHTVPYGDRSGTVIEPRLTYQWFVDAKTLAGPAIEAVKNGDTRFVPANWEKTYFHWMENIQPWCISRQLWWGHQIPAWYGPNIDDNGDLRFVQGVSPVTGEGSGQNKVFVAESERSVIQQTENWYAEKGISGQVKIYDSEAEAGKAFSDHYLEGGPQILPLYRDEDVLDTWFSSALWPFSTLGWPEDTPELARYYPTTTLVTGHDIIFFWVARMMMMGRHFMRDVPFRTVYIHGLVRDPQGQKMSKSKGNVVDPLETMDKYGADALRFTMAAMETQGRDIKLSESRIEGYRNFGTKLWNAARLTEMYECDYGADFDPGAVESTLNRWIVGEVAKTEARIRESLEAFRFNDAAAAIYHFIWHSYCDWYLEFIKPVLMDGEAVEQAETRATAAWALDQILILLHPFMPFITEELWGHLRERDTLLILADWPAYPDSYGDAAAFNEIDWVIRLISEVRAVRAEMNVPAGARIPLAIQDAGAETRERLTRYEPIIARLARLETIETHEGTIPEGAVQIVLDEATIILPLADVIDIAAERARLEREIEKTQKEIAGLDKRLDNPGFLEKAPESVVAETRARRDEFKATGDKLKSALARLG